MISKDTTAKEVVVQAIREFALTATPDAYSLCEVSVTPEGVIKQRRLPDQLSKLADRIQLSGRWDGDRAKADDASLLSQSLVKGVLLT